MDRRTKRHALVQETMAEIIERVGQRTPDRALLSEVSRILQRLTAAQDLFPLEDFPAPEAGAPQTSLRYLLNEQPDHGFALYVNSIVPGKRTAPHNHGTWAAIVALAGDELNRIYRRIDDGSDPERAQLELDREYVVRPGAPIEFMPDDIHSIHVDGASTVRHLHLYGRALETLNERIGFDLETGRVLNYNQNFMRPTVGKDFA